MASGLITAFLGEGLAASRPADPDVGSAIALYWSTDTNQMSAWLENAWVEDVFGTGGALIAANNLSDVVSAATSRTNLGVGTGDSPQFTAINLGHATDTTIARSGAGDITVEGNAVYRAGGTDVPVTDGGTGASTAAGARTNLGLVIGTDVLGIGGGTLTGDLSVPDEAYGVGWNGSAEAPTKNAIYDKIETIGWILVDSDTASASANIDLTVDSAAYNEWLLMGADVVLSGANELALQVGDGVGPTFDTGNNYDFGIEWRYGTTSTGTFSRAFVSATSTMRLGTVSSASSPSGVSLDFECRLKYLASGKNMRLINGSASYDGTGGLTRTLFDGVHLNAAYTTTALRILPSAGTITSGKFLLYGRTR